MVNWNHPVRAEQLEQLHGDDAACPGPWRVRRKLPHLLPGGAGATGRDAVVVSALLGHGELLADLAQLCAEALRRGGEAEVEELAIKGLTTRVAASLAVALMESDLAERVSLLLAREQPFAEGWRACPE